MEAARSGQSGAFAALVEELRPNIFQLAGRFSRTAPDFDDLSQEICLRLWKSLPALRDPQAFLDWFKALAVRTCYDWLRRRRRRQDLEVPITGLEFLPAVAATEDADRAAEIVHAALARLKPDERLVLTLQELEDHSIAEISMLTGWSEGNVKVRAHRARAALRQILLGGG